MSGAPWGAQLERAAGIEPASTVWKTVALPLDDTRKILSRDQGLIAPGAAGEARTHHLLRTKQAPRYLGLSSVVEPAGVEPATSCMPSRRSPS